MKTSKARVPCGKASSLRRQPETIRGVVRHAVARFKGAKLTFAHGTTDPVAEAAFLVGEALRIPPERFERLAAARVTAVQQAKALDLIEQRVRTRKPAAYLVRRIYMRGDLFAPIRSARYDLIVANPPCVDTDGMTRLPPECQYEPRLALDCGAGARLS